MDVVAVALFFGATFSHFALTRFWLGRWCGARLTNAEERFFYTMVFGFGALQSLLHLLACTAGISVASGVIGIGLIHGAALLYDRRIAARRAPQVSAELTTTSVATLVQGLADSAVAMAGGAAIVACVLTWLYRASQSLQIVGIDSTHYHAPYAINYARGVGLFGFAATPHLYPMGASILGAWFFQPLSSPLLLDLTNLLPFLLLFASLAYVFRLLTEAAALDWVPVVFLLLFTGRLFRVSLFISADLFYAATFTAVFAQLCSIWIRTRLDTYEWLALGASTGLLLASKIQGPFSAVLLFGVCGAALAGRRLIAGVQLPGAPSVGVALAALGLLIAAGGIWQIRSWVRFGSPIAPTGLSLFGVTIFPGPPGRSTDAVVSVLADMQSTPGYDLWERFRFFTSDWVGRWPWVFSLAVIPLLADVAYQLCTVRQLRARTAHQLFALAFFALLCGIHMYVLIGVPFSSLEILRGQPLRYILPFFALYAVLMLALLFRDSVPWVRAGWTKWLVLPALLYLLADYNRATQMPEQWNRLNGVEDMLNYRWLPVALVIVLPWYVRVAAWRRYATWACATAVVACFAILVHRSLTQATQLDAEAALRFERQLSRFQLTGAAPSAYHAALFRALAYERQHQLRCARRRLFNVSRIDFPIYFQDPGFNTIIIDVEQEATRIAPLLQSDGPGHTPCDFIIAVQRAEEFQGVTYPAVTETAIRALLQPRGDLQAIGDAGRYRVYHVG